MHEEEPQNAYSRRDAIATLKGYMRQIQIHQKRREEEDKANENCDDDA